MERIEFFRTAISNVMKEYSASLTPSIENLKIVPVIDKENDQYQLLALGWEGSHRVFNLLFHLDIEGEKIWVQKDNMEDSVAEMLVEKGVSKKDIVLGYFPEFHRRHTEYAVA